ncbi:hypothetical protein N7493_005191 [Penicillium malachiteum]|uniref:Uncharacterized protein n=1 Tax=Penicillium malachiteum TaxID=1324776 RepID=A0AAD6HM78_9EURO|nr:hypothetical protein N7493_005191 [Penicillium malachiteum]
MLSKVSSQASGITELSIPNEWKTLLRGLLDKGVRVTVQDVQRVWQLALGRVNQIDGLASQTFQKFAQYEPRQLVELAEASTSVGLHVGTQGRRGRTRPIFGLFFYGEPVAVAVQVGSNGFIVSMNPSNLEKVVKSNPRHRSINELIAILRASHSWPI